MPELTAEPAPSSPVTAGAGSPQGAKGRRRWVLVAAAAMALFALGLAMTGFANLTNANTTGRGNATDFTLGSVQKDQPSVALADYRGQPVVLNFFASWCVPCRREMPAFEAVHQRVGDRVAFIGVDHQDNRPDALDLIRQTGISYPTGFDPDGTIAPEYGVVGMPTTVFISADGRILEQHTGALSESDLQASIDRLFPG